MELNVQSREVTWKKVKLLRKAGLVPAVVYGSHLPEALSLSIDKVELLKVYAKTGKSTPIELKGHTEELVLVHEIQLHPVSDHVIHVDFIAVKRDVKVTAEVPLVFEGESPYEKNGLGRVQTLKRTIEVEALPLDLPHDIKVDVSTLTEEGMVIFAKDLVLGDAVALEADPELAIATTVAFVEEVEEETTLEEGGEAAEGASEEAPTAE